MKIRACLLLALRTGLAAVFVVSGFQKLAVPAENFAAVIESFEVVHGPPVVWISHALPWLEFIVGVTFLLGLWTRASLLVLWAMNSAFIGLLSSALGRKLPIDKCGCFGEALTLSPRQMLAVDGAVWALFLLFFIFYKRIEIPSLDRRFRS